MIIILIGAAALAASGLLYRLCRAVDGVSS